MDRASIITTHLEYMERVFNAKGKFLITGVLLATRDPDGEPLPEVTLVQVVGAPDTPTLAAAMKEMARKTSAVGSIVMMETWMARATPEEARTGKFRLPSERDDKTEHLLLLVDVEGTREGRFATITREPDGRGVVSGWTRMEGTLESRMFGLLPHLN